jgi:DNA polymerase I
MAAKKTNKKKLVLLDAHAIIHRAYHALPDFSTAQGVPTGALYGLATMLIKIIEELNPEYIVACFDLPGLTYRHEAYENYKAGRKVADDNLKIQLESAKDIFVDWGIPIFSLAGFEADDMLGTIVYELRNNKEIEIIIASGDMDTMQLVRSKEVMVYTLRKGIKDTILYDEEGVVKRFGFPPKLLPDFKGLRGDPSDNIIGVKGIGEKTATSLIQTFGTIEEIYKALKKGKDEYKKAGISDRIAELLLANEEEALFSKTLATIRHDAPIDFKLPKPWRENLDLDVLIERFRTLEFRTMGERVKMLLKTLDNKKDGVKEPKLAKYIPTTKNMEKSDRDLCLMLWVIDSNLTNPTDEDILRFTKAKNFEDAKKVLEAELDKRNVRKIYEEIEKPLRPVVEEMNKRGIKIDKKALAELSKSYHKTLSELEKKIWKMAGEEFNINSPKQLGEILFVKMNLAGKRQKKTATGNFSTKESELEKLKDIHPIIENILEYRELQKLLSTYIDTIPDQLDEDNRLHSEFLQAGTTTGRMGSINPNLQNIPIKTELGRNIRKAFVTEEGFELVALDYSQIELRIAAILSEDKKLTDIFKKGEDVHTGVAVRVFGVKPEEVTKTMRIKAKTINFGILYGMGVNALRANLKTDRKEAQEFYNNYFETFKELAEYLDRVKADTERKGYTETLFGRRRYFAGIKSPLPFIKAQAERMAINAPIQGTQADLIKIAMKKIDDYIKSKNCENEAHLVLQVHDEVVYEIKKDLARDLAIKFKEIMENVLDEKESKGIPIVAEAHIGENWNDMKKI